MLGNFKHMTPTSDLGNNLLVLLDHNNIVLIWTCSNIDFGIFLLRIKLVQDHKGLIII